MIAKRLEIFDLRNVDEAIIEFDPGVNIFVGDNAQGKTNALEALYLFAGGKSFRAKSEKELIRFGRSCGGTRLIMQSDLRRGEDNMTIEYYLDEKRGGTRRRMTRNGVEQKKIGDMFGIFRAVLFCPEHLMIVKGGPGERRSFIDIALSQLKPVYLKELQRYHAVLAERNKLLKDARENRAVYDMTNELWAEQLAACAGYVTSQRAQYVKELEKVTKENFKKMTDGREVPSLSYRSSAGAEIDPTSEVEVREKYYELFTSNADREILAGTTLWGVHRDDILIELDGKEARLYASQGQDRSIALALKLAEGELCEVFSGESPVFLFDDVMSELDEGRREFLLSNFQNRQIIITSCEPGFFASCGAKKIDVRGGEYYVNGVRRTLYDWVE